MLAHGALLLSALCVASPAAQDRKPLRLVAPPGLPAPVPGHETFRPEVAALGRALFADPGLSIDRKTSCASCHAPAHGFASEEALPPGSLGKHALRNAPTLYNRAWGRRFSWDGKAGTLEEQVILPIANPDEMALPVGDAIARLREDAKHGPEFERLFGHPANRADLATALASYVRTLTYGDSVVDQFRSAKGNHLTQAERAGMWIFESKGACWRCHRGGNFTDEQFHNTGVGVVDGKPRPGRMAVTKRPTDAGAFKTPTLRALAETAPYMHDGSIKTLEDVVAFYRRGGNPNPTQSKSIRPLSLTDAEAASLVAFLRALSRPAIRGKQVR